MRGRRREPEGEIPAPRKPQFVGAPAEPLSGRDLGAAGASLFQSIPAVDTVASLAARPDPFVAVCAVALMTIGICVVERSAALATDPLEATTRKGPVEATVHLEPGKPLIGDLVTLRLRVVAAKGVELLMPEFGQALERFAILDFASAETIDDEGRTVATQRYELEPPRSGQQSIPPIMVEFVDRRDGAKPAPEGFDAYELLTERIGFEVQSVLPVDAKAQLNPPLGDLPPLEAPRGSTWPWLVVAVLLMGGAAPVLWRAWFAWRRKARRSSAYDVAAARLARLLDRPPRDPDQVDPFFVELSAIVRRYLEDRFDLRAPELTTEEFLASMSQSPDLSRDHQTLLHDFLRRADLVKFANFVPTASDVKQSVAAAQRFLEETRQDAPLVETPPAEGPPAGTDRPAPSLREVARV